MGDDARSPLRQEVAALLDSTGPITEREMPLPRPAQELSRDLDALLGLALDADNFDLTAEVLWSWPMLRLPWTRRRGSRWA